MLHITPTKFETNMGAGLETHSLWTINLFTTVYSVGVMFFYPTSSDFPALSGKILKNVTNMSFALIYWLSCVEI